MTKEDKQNWWQPGVTLFAQISAWIAAPIIIAIYLGRWLDNKYGKEAFYYFICVGIAFVISNVGIIYNTIKYVKQMEKEAKAKQESQKMK